GGDAVDHGNHGVAHDVLEHDGAVAHALGPGQADVVLVQFVHHVAPHPHRVARDAAQRHGYDGQYPRLGVVGVKQHRQVQQVFAVKLQKQVVNRRRNGVDDDDVQRAQPVEKRAFVARHEDAQRKPDGDGQGQRRPAQKQRVRNLRRDDFPDGHVGPEDGGGAQIAPQKLQVEVFQLNVQRVQQAHAAQNGLLLLRVQLVVVGAEKAFDGHKPHEDEHDRHDDEQRQQRLKKALYDVSQQSDLSSAGFPPSDPAG